MTLCECGCGDSVNTGRRFLRGHNRRGIPSYNSGVSPSEETRKKLSNALKGKIRSQETRDKIAKANTGKRVPLEVRLKMSASKMGHRVSDRSREITRKGNAERIWSEESRRKLSESVKRLWHKTDFVEKWKDSKNLKPNKPETTILNLLNDLYPNEWKYTGDFSFMINGKNPDFVHKEKARIIELFGDYWHRGENPQDRAEIFKPFGYQTLVIWESQLSDLEAVKQSISEFVQ